MRFFKHGDVLAISLPESIRHKLGIAENDEYEFIERPDGSLGLVKKTIFNPIATKTVTTAPGKTPEKTAPSTARAPTAKTTASTTAAMPPARTTPSSPTALNTKPATPAGSTPPTNKSAGGTYASTNTALDRQGFLVLENEMDAKDFSYRFETSIKSGDIKGVRGFDKKFYLASRAYSESFADKLLVALKEPQTIVQLAALVKQPQEGVLSLLYLLKEEGEIIEKKRGLFARVL